MLANIGFHVSPRDFVAFLKPCNVCIYPSAFGLEAVAKAYLKIWLKTEPLMPDLLAHLFFSLCFALLFYYYVFLCSHSNQKSHQWPPIKHQEPDTCQYYDSEAFIDLIAKANGVYSQFLQNIMFIYVSILFLSAQNQCSYKFLKKSQHSK